MSNINISEKELNELNESIKIIVLEYSSKKETMEKIKPIILELKTEYNNKIKVYQEITKKLISEENLIEDIENKKVKLEKKQKLLLINLNKECYNHLVEISQNINNKLSYDTLSNFLKFLMIKFNDPYEGILIFRNEFELKCLLYYLNKIYLNLDNTNIEKYKEYYISYQENSKLIFQYPFDFLYEYLGTIFSKIELKNKLNVMKNEINKEIENKNKMFLTLKKIETEIKQNDSLYRSIAMYRKLINKILEKYKESVENKDYNSLKQILMTIEKTKNINQVNNIDGISSLSMKSEYTLTENSSVNNLSISYIILPNLNNNGVINLEERKKKKKISVKVEEIKTNKTSKKNNKKIHEKYRDDNSINTSSSKNKSINKDNSISISEIKIKEKKNISEDEKLKEKLSDNKSEEISYENLKTNENIEEPSTINTNTINTNNKFISKEENEEFYKRIIPEKLKGKNKRNNNNNIKTNNHYKTKEDNLILNKDLKLTGLNNITLIQNSICDEILSNSVIKPSDKNYINELNKKNNKVNFYLNPELLKKKEEFNNLIIEKPIETSNCCISCT